MCARQSASDFSFGLGLDLKLAIPREETFFTKVCEAVIAGVLREEILITEANCCEAKMSF